MDFKKLFKKNDKAVSPVIGVILMVAITVILAAAIGSSVFNQSNPGQTSSKANINVKAVAIAGAGTATDPAYITIEHLAGDSLNFKDSKAKITATINGKDSATVYTTAITGTVNVLGVMSAGDVKQVSLVKETTPGTGTTSNIDSSANIKGKIVNIKITDTTTNQVVCDRDVQF